MRNNKTQTTQTKIDHIHQLYALLGEDTVLLPIPDKKKGPIFKGWQNTTVEQTKESKYQRKLQNGNIGVLLGEASNGLCSIDLDSDEVFNEFLELNPKLKETLQTKGARGANVWVRIIGDYPKLSKFADWGEWRANGGQTVIHGVHPLGKPYKIINEAKPVEIRFEEIIWPKYLNLPWENDKDTTSTTNKPSPSFNSSNKLNNCKLYTYNSIDYITKGKIDLPKIKRLIKAEKESDKRREIFFNDLGKKNLVELYKTYIYKFYSGETSNRNDIIVKASNRLFYAVGIDTGIKLLMEFYDIYCDFYKDSREQHKKECVAMFEGLENTYITNLPDEENELYEICDSRGRDVFRILRDLASLDKPDNEKGIFYLPCHNLASRLEIHDIQAQRLIHRFIKYGLVKVVEKGLQWGKGEKRRATTYKWLGSLESK